MLALKTGRNTGLVIDGEIFRYAKLSMLTGVVYTLKDTADRGRLEGTRSVQLKFLSSFVLGTMFGNLKVGRARILGIG